MDPSVLDAIDAHLERLGQRTVLDLLRPGLAEMEARAQLLAGQIEAPDPDLVKLYGWHDGTAVEGRRLGETWLFPGYYLSSLSEALRNFAACKENPRWNPR